MNLAVNSYDNDAGLQLLLIFTHTGTTALLFLEDMHHAEIKREHYQRGIVSRSAMHCLFVDLNIILSYCFIHTSTRSCLVGLDAPASCSAPSNCTSRVYNNTPHTTLAETVATTLALAALSLTGRLPDADQPTTYISSAHSRRRRRHSAAPVSYRRAQTVLRVDV